MLTVELCYDIIISRSILWITDSPETMLYIMDSLGFNIPLYLG